MKIKRRSKWTHPLDTIGLPLVPTLTYTIFKIFGVPMKSYGDLVWLIMIPVLIMVWFFIAFKIVRK